MNATLIILGWVGTTAAFFWALLLAYVLWLRNPKLEFQNDRVRRMILADFATHLVCAALMIFFVGVATITAWR